MAPSTASAGAAKEQGRPCHLFDPGWRLESRGKRDGPIDRSDLPVRRRISDMTPYDGLSTSKIPSASGCTCSPSRKDDHCGSLSLHDRFRARHRVRRIRPILDLVCRGTEQNGLKACGARKTHRKFFFPFHVDHVRQWRRGRKHASAG